MEIFDSVLTGVFLGLATIVAGIGIYLLWNFAKWLLAVWKRTRSGAEITAKQPVPMKRAEEKATPESAAIDAITSRILGKELF